MEVVTRQLAEHVMINALLFGFGFGFLIGSLSSLAIVHFGLIKPLFKKIGA